MRRLISIGFVVLRLRRRRRARRRASDDGPKGTTYKIVFDNAFGLTEGGDFRVGGVNAGSTTEFEADATTSPPKAEVTAEITEPGFDDFREDASCNIKPQSLIGEYYVDCQPGTSKKKLKDGATVPVEQTESTIPQDLVNNILRRPYRERLRLIINELGTGLAGRPEDLQEVLKRAHPGLRETSKVLKILGDQNRVIENFIADSDTVVAELEARKQEVSRFIVEAGETAEISATRREELRQTFNKLPGFLDELDARRWRASRSWPTSRSRCCATPAARRARPRRVPRPASARSPRPRGPPSARSARRSEVGRARVREGQRTRSRSCARLARGRAGHREAAAPVPRVAGRPPPRDRQRPARRDQRPAGQRPVQPRQDRQRLHRASRPSGNFFFWQGLSINGFDDISHILRISVVLSEGANGCSGYENSTPQRDPSLAEKFRQCNQWLGPNQPGINTPDFTQGARRRRRSPREAGKPAKKVGERRKAGQPDAGPLPGQQDISKPQITLPPAAPGADRPPAQAAEDRHRAPRPAAPG